jgi:hypothetical protein
MNEFFGKRPDRTTMSPSSDAIIAKKARARAEADFATWLMMAKLGAFDDLPSNAQSFLISYRTRLETMSEAQSTAMAVREVYSAYYSEMGGAGVAPEPKVRTQTAGKVTRLQKGPKSQQDLPLRKSMRPMTRRFVPILLFFVSIAILIIAYWI